MLFILHFSQRLCFNALAKHNKTDSLFHQNIIAIWKFSRSQDYLITSENFRNNYFYLIPFFWCWSYIQRTQSDILYYYHDLIKVIRKHEKRVALRSFVAPLFFHFVIIFYSCNTDKRYELSPTIYALEGDFVRSLIQMAVGRWTRGGHMWCVFCNGDVTRSIISYGKGEGHS